MAVVDVVELTGLVVEVNKVKVTVLVVVVNVVKVTGLVVLVNEVYNNGFGGCRQCDESDGFVCCGL